MSTDSHRETNQAYYDRISHVYDALADANEGPARRAGVAALAPKSGEAVLEIGFGPGNEILDMARLVGPSGAVAGIDVSSGMLNVATRKLQEAKLSTAVDLRLGDARSLPFADESFDAAFTSFTLELFPEADIPVVLTEVRRVLKPGGRVGIVAMALVRPGEHTSTLEKTYVWMHRHFPHIVDCRPIDPAREVVSAGFELLRHDRREIWTMPVGVVVGRKAG